jgi:hypothetical protein
MDYSLEKVSTVAVCDTLLELALEDKQSLERRRRNLDESIDNFDDRTEDIDTQLEAVQALLQSFTTLYGSLPEGKDKVDTNLEIKRLEARKAQLDKSGTGYNVYSLIGKQVDFNLLDSQVIVIDAYIAAVEAKKTELANAA